MTNAPDKGASSGDAEIKLDSVNFSTSPRRRDCNSVNGPRHITEGLAKCLTRHEAFLRNMAEKEASRGEFTVGLSRCIDLLDNDAGSLP